MDILALQQFFGIEGKLAVITDSGGNVSLEVARVLAAAGARIIVADRELSAIGPTLDMIGTSGGEAMAVEADVESKNSLVALFEQVEQSWEHPTS